MLVKAFCSSSVAAVLPSVCVSGLHQLWRAPAVRARQFHAYPAPIDSVPVSVLLEPVDGSTHSLAAEQQHSEVSKELLRYVLNLVSPYFVSPAQLYMVGHSCQALS